MACLLHNASTSWSLLRRGICLLLYLLFLALCRMSINKFIYLAINVCYLLVTARRIHIDSSHVDLKLKEVSLLALFTWQCLESLSSELMGLSLV